MIVGEFNFQDLLSEINNPNVIFVPKVESSEDIAKPVVSLANGDGGSVIIGFDKNNLNFPGTTIGADWLGIVIKNECTPEITVKFKEMFHSDKKTVMIIVEEGLEKPYETMGNTYYFKAPESKKTEPSKPEPSPDIASNHSSPDISTHTINDSHPKDINSEDLNRRQKKILNYLVKHEHISNSIYRDINKVSAKTSHNEISDLVSKGYLKQEGEGRVTKYVLKEASEEVITDKSADLITKPQPIEAQEKIETEDFENIAEKPLAEELLINEPLFDNPDEIESEIPLTFDTETTPLEVKDEELGFQDIFDAESDNFLDNLDLKINDLPDSEKSSSEIDEFDSFLAENINPNQSEISPNQNNGLFGAIPPESSSEKKTRKTEKKAFISAITMPLFNLNDNKMTKTNLREAGNLHTHMPN